MYELVVYLDDGWEVVAKGFSWPCEAMAYADAEWTGREREVQMTETADA
jgi:hypothetical protein